MNFIQLFYCRKTLRHFLLYCLPYFPEFLVDNLMHQIANMFQLPVAVIQHLLRVFRLIQYSEFGKQFIDDFDEF